MRRRRRGTFSAIWTWIAGHRSEILRVVLWVALLVLAILAWNEPRGWWSARTKVEYLGTAILLILNIVLILRGRRRRRRQTQTQTQPAPATGTGGMTNGIIDICLPYTRIRIPNWFYLIRIENDGMRYSIIPTLFGKIRMPSDLCRCADPDISLEWTQLMFGTARVVMKREKKSVPLVFWVKEEHAMHVISILSGQITIACAANNMKRFVPPS